MAASIIAVICLHFISFLIKELNNYIQSIEESLTKDLKVVVSRLNTAYMVGFGMATSYVTLIVVAASSDFILHAATYALLMVYTTSSPLFQIAVITVSRISQADNVPIVPISNSDEENGR